jgi:peptidoglycan/xylan/chitin deacetylase (PgdA/CDA1 family)
MKKYINKVRRKVADISYNFYGTINSCKKLVTFTFDDVPKSAFENAGKILSKYNLNGTFYVALAFMNKSDSDGLFTSKDIENCFKSGNELACHTYSHFSFFETNNNQFIANDLAKNHSEFKKLNLDTTLRNFSYPYGEQTRLAKKHVSKLYTTCRGIDLGMNVGKIDFNNLKAIQLYESRNSLPNIDKIIYNFKNKGGWLIFYTHDVQDDYSAFGCSPAYFEAVVEKVIMADFEIKNVSQVTEILGITKNKCH